MDLGAEMVEDGSLQLICNVKLFPPEGAFDSAKSIDVQKTFFFYSINDVQVSKSVFHLYKSGAIIKEMTRSSSMMCNYVTMKQNYEL